MKRILFLSNHKIWSIDKNKGAVSQLKTILGYLKNNFLIYYLTPNKNEINHKNLKFIHINNPAEKKYQRGLLARAAHKLYYFLCVNHKFYQIGKKIIIKENIELIYVYGECGVPAAFLLSKKFKIPFVRRFQGTILYPIIKSPLKLSKKFDHVVSFLLPSDLTIMTNDGTRGDTVLKFFHTDMKTVKFWFNGVNIPKQGAPTKKNVFTANSFNILTVSRLVNWKKVERAIFAIGYIRKITKKKIHLYIIGEGEEKQKLELLIKNLKLTRHVTLLGGVCHEKLNEYYSSADVFLSLYDLSNVGNPLLEALSYGKAIITLNNGDTNKIIKNGFNGVLIDFDGESVLTNVIGNKIIELMNKPSLRNRLEKNARKYALDHFWSWEERMRAEIIEVSKLGQS